MSKDVYVVHCVDTEGPLYESLKASFDRLKEIFGIELPATRENLIKIQNKELDFRGQEDLIADAFSEKRILTLGTWSDVDAVLDVLMSKNFRYQYPDSDGNGWVFNWFCLDHVGFTGKNPRRRDSGYGNIYEHYLEKLEENGSSEIDLLQFHYHPLPFNGHFNYCGTSYVNSNNIFEIITHRIIDNDMFPAAYRAGMEAERPDSHWFLEQWIPFDYSNDSYIKDNSQRQPDLRDGRYGDWRRATMEWRPYHPSHDDYQVEGNCHRWITRCVSLDSRVAKLSIEDVRNAFESAENDKPVIVAFANHDFRDMREEVLNAMKMFSIVSKEFPEVKFHYTDAIHAMIQAEKLNNPKMGLKLKIEENTVKDSAELFVSVQHDIFGSQPFLAIRTVTGQYLWDNFDYGLDKHTWSYVFDDKTINFSNIETIAVACNNPSGMTEIFKIKPKENIARHLMLHGHRKLMDIKNKWRE